MSIFLLKGKDPADVGYPVKTFIVVADTEIQARKLLPARFEVYEIEIPHGGFGELSGIIGWLGEVAVSEDRLSLSDRKRDVPNAVDEAFYAGTRSAEIPFALNDSVQIVDGEHAGREGAVISIGAIEPEVTFHIEFAETGLSADVPVSALRPLK